MKVESENQYQNTKYKRRKRKQKHTISEINVTPFVDVMLVLLIVFMITAPLLTVGVPVNLPKTNAKPMQQENEPIAITIDQTKKIYIQDTEITFDTINDKLTAIAQNGYDERIYIRGDENVDYGYVLNVMSEISAAGFKNIALISDTQKK